MSSSTLPENVIDYLLSERSIQGPGDVLELMPGMSYDQAYEAQFEAKILQSGANGPIIGHQASLTSAAAKKLGAAGMPMPLFGTLQLRNWHNPVVPIPVRGRDFYVESETGMRLGKALQGPGVTAQSAREAVASLYAAMEVVPLSQGVVGRSGQHTIAIHNFGTYILFGDQIGDGQTDVRDLPVELLFDGKPAGAAVAGDSGGDPFNVLAEMANCLARFGRRLEPGMVIMTGSCMIPTKLTPGTKTAEIRFGDRHVKVDFVPE